MVGSPPLSLLTVRLTDRCNLACAYCRQHRTAGRTMRPSVLRRSLMRAMALAAPRLTVVLTGGEPLLAPHLMRLTLRLAARRRAADPALTVRLLTNGLLLDTALVGELASHGVELQISCDGLADAPRELRALLPAIRRAYPDYWRRQVSISLVFTPATVGCLADAVAGLLAAGVACLQINPADGYGHWGDAACATLVRQLDRIAELAAPTAVRPSPVTFLRPRAPRPAPRDGPVCGAGSPASRAVDVDGTWHGCAVLRAAGRSQTVADLRISRRRSPRGPCAACPLAGTCLVCPLAGDDPREVPDAHCLFQRRTHDLRLAVAMAPRLLPDLEALGLPPARHAHLERLFACLGHVHAAGP